MANSSEARPLRRTKTKLFPGQLLPNVSMNTRKPLTEEEKEQRRIKVTGKLLFVSEKYLTEGRHNFFIFYKRVSMLCTSQTI